MKFAELCAVTLGAFPKAAKPNALLVHLDRGRSGGVWRNEEETTPLFDGEKAERHRQYTEHFALEGL